MRLFRCNSEYIRNNSIKINKLNKYRNDEQRTNKRDKEMSLKIENLL